MKRGTIQRSAGQEVPCVWAADRWWLRLRGLLGRPRLDADGTQALMIVPCASVHTLWMRYPLDLVFLDRQGMVIGTREGVAPWRAAACRGARTTLEFHAGALARVRPALGEHWRWRADTTREGLE